MWGECATSSATQVIWLQGTVALNDEQFALYVRLFMYMYDQGGPVPFDTQKLKHVLRKRPQDIRRVVDQLVAMGKLVHDENGMLRNGRVDEMTEKWQSFDRLNEPPSNRSNGAAEEAKSAAKTTHARAHANDRVLEARIDKRESILSHSTTSEPRPVGLGQAIAQRLAQLKREEEERSHEQTSNIDRDRPGSEAPGTLAEAKGVDSEVPLEDYEAVLQGVGAKDLAEATLNLLKKSKFMPFPAELYQETQRLEQIDRRHEESAKHQHFEEDDVLTPGQKLGFPLLRDDPAARERASALWAKVRPTMTGLKSFDDASRDAAELKRQHEGAAVEKAIAEAKKRDQARHPQEPMTEAERLERIRQIGAQPTQPTEALLRSLANPMNPPKPEG